MNDSPEMFPEGLRPEFRQRAEEMADEGGPILGFQRARLGAERFAAFTQGQAEVQAMALFLVMSAMTVPQTGYTQEAIDAFRQDARDVRMAAGRWAKTCEQLADYWQAQREEAER